MKKQKKKIKNKQKKLNIGYIKPKIKNIEKCQHTHVNNNGECCNCGKSNALFYILKK